MMNNEKIDKILDKYEGDPSALIHVLMEIQSLHHWLPKETLEKVSAKLDVPLSKVMQTASFYKTFSLVPKGRHEVHVCMGTSCHIRGAQTILDEIQDLTGIKPGETDSESRFSLEIGNCLGCCTLGPEIVVDGKHHSRIGPEKVKEVLKNYE